MSAPPPARPPVGDHGRAQRPPHAAPFPPPARRRALPPAVRARRPRHAGGPKGQGLPRDAVEAPVCVGSPGPLRGRVARAPVGALGGGGVLQLRGKRIL